VKIDILLGTKATSNEYKADQRQMEKKKDKKSRRKRKKRTCRTKAKGMPTFQRIFLSLLGAKNRSDLRLEQHRHRKQVEMKKTLGLLVITVVTLTSVVLFLRFILHF
jgi:hypothetical protein